MIKIVFQLAIISLIFQLNSHYIIERIYFFTKSLLYCTILRENFVSLPENYLLFIRLLQPYIAYLVGILKDIIASQECKVLKTSQ